MRFSDTVWQVSSEGTMRQASVSHLYAEGTKLPFFATQIEAANEAEGRFVALATADQAQADHWQALADAMAARADVLDGP